MATVINTKTYESIPERDGRKYVTYVFTSEFGDTHKIGPVLEEADEDIQAKAKVLEARFLLMLKAGERDEALRLALEEGVNPADLVYKYNIKAAVVNDLYSSKVQPLEAEVANSLTTLQNASNKIKLFLGLI